LDYQLNKVLIDIFDLTISTVFKPDAAAKMLKSISEEGKPLDCEVRRFALATASSLGIVRATRLAKRRAEVEQCYHELVSYSFPAAASLDAGARRSDLEHTGSRHARDRRPFEQF
jgi:hypothetical protein